MPSVTVEAVLLQTTCFQSWTYGVKEAKQARHKEAEMKQTQDIAPTESDFACQHFKLGFAAVACMTIASTLEGTRKAICGVEYALSL
eukprot:1957860-Amphidinium_carterae.1